MVFTNLFRKQAKNKPVEQKKKPTNLASQKSQEKKPVTTDGKKSADLKTKEKKGSAKESPYLKVHTTEKTNLLSEKGAYTFKVDSSFNKIMVAKEVLKVYGVQPRKIAILNKPSKTIIVRGKKGLKRGFKKAVVYLKKGDKITV